MWRRQNRPKLALQRNPMEWLTVVWCRIQRKKAPNCVNGVLNCPITTDRRIENEWDSRVHSHQSNLKCTKWVELARNKISCSMAPPTSIPNPLNFKWIMCIDPTHEFAFKFEFASETIHRLRTTGSNANEHVSINVRGDYVRGHVKIGSEFSAGSQPNIQSINGFEYPPIVVNANHVVGCSLHMWAWNRPNAKMSTLSSQQSMRSRNETCRP